MGALGRAVRLRAAADANPSDVGDFLDTLKATRVADCSTAAWRFLGISLAGWNAAIAFILASCRNGRPQTLNGRRIFS